MGRTIIEKILASHSTYSDIKPGEIIDVSFDVRVARDLGGANIIKHIQEHGLSIADPDKTFFTFDSNFQRTDRHAEGIYQCRMFARENNIRIFDFETGIGSHLMIDQGIVVPGSIVISNDPYVNVMGAIGALGFNLGEKDIAAAFAKGKLWFRVPQSIKIDLKGKIPPGLSAKDLAMNLFEIFGSNKLVGKIVELTGEAIDLLSLDSRISLASYAAELNAVTFLLIPNREVQDYCEVKSGKKIEIILPDADAEYEDVLNLDIRKFSKKIIKVGIPPEISEINRLPKIGIESAFLGTSSNGRIEDLRIVAGVLKGRKIANGIVFRITPATDQIWTQSLQEGLIDIFKESGAIVTNAGAGDVIYETGGENLGEVAVSSGIPAYPGITIRGDLYLASPSIVAASAIAGFITTPDKIPDKPETLFSFIRKEIHPVGQSVSHQTLISRPTILKGKVWYIPFDNIDTDMIYHRRYEEFSETGKIGEYTFSNLSGFEDFGSKAIAGDIVVTGRNFGLGSSRQQAVDCFKVLGIQAIVAKSFAIIYERNAINAGLPIIVCSTIDNLQLQTGDTLMINLLSGELKNERTNISVFGEKFSNIQMEIYQQGGLFTE